ncbi:STAS domain-containing protein [Nonomuraea sp. NPDC050643]|uniref:STAS domain-containing protein n=1 Tax=Nonomuraea sp. NPDC050643 TaxID=3155660 RepID=UPI0033E6DC69
MTEYAAAPLTLILVTPEPHVLRIGVHGDLDHATAGELMDAASAALDGDLRDLRLDCAGLGVCDSSGLSVLLMIRRRTSAAGIRLHLDRRPPSLDRLLDVSGTFEHLTGGPPRTEEEHLTGSPSPERRTSSTSD